MDLIRELSRLEKRMESQQLMNVEHLTQSDMDINEFILCNFVQKRNDEMFEVNYQKISEYLPHLQLLQQKTCEQIAISVDMNLDQYVDISERLQSLKDKLLILQTQYESVEGDIELTKDTLQEQITKINAILENLKLINKLHANMDILKQVLNKIEQLNEMIPRITSDECDSQTLMFCYLLIQTRDQYHYQVDVCVHCRQLCQKFSIINQLNTLTQLIQNYLESKCVTSLTDLERVDKEQLALIFQCFFVLNQPKLPEKLIVQFILKPQLDRLYDELLKNKTTMLRNDSMIEKFAEQVLEINSSQGHIIEQTLELLPQCPFQFRQMLMELVYIYLSQKDCSFVYSVGVPDTFHRNYKTLQSLKLKLNIDNQKQLELEKRFYDKWNLNSYFSLRYNQIVRSYEQGMEEQLKSISNYMEQQGPQPQINLKNILIKHIYSCISKNVFIKTIGSKFIRLIFQLINRFCTQMLELKDQLSEEQTQISNDITLNLCEAWKEIPEHLNELQQYYNDTEPLKDAIKTKLFNLTSQFIDLTIIPITNQCFQNLEPFNGIPAKFRMTKRESPSKASNFTGNIFRPLQTYITKTTLHESVQQLMILKVLQNTQKKRFQQMKDQVMDGCSKQELLMQKLGVNTKKDNTDATDYEKIQQQFELDQEEILITIQQKFDITRVKIISKN